MKTQITFTTEQVNEFNRLLNSLPISEIGTVQQIFALFQTGVNQAAEANSAEAAIEETNDVQH